MRWEGHVTFKADFRNAHKISFGRGHSKIPGCTIKFDAKEIMCGA
jgi:hypothetical protein